MLQYLCNPQERADVISLEVDEQDSSRVLVTHKEYEIDLVKAIPGVLYRQKRTTLPKSWATYCTAGGVIGEDLQCGPLYAQWLNEEYTSRVKPCLDLRTLTDVDPVGFDERLYPFQRAGVAFLSIAQRALLGDEVGSGKTVQSILALKRLSDYGHDVFPCLTITLPSIKAHWEDEWKTWFPGARVVRVKGTATQRRKALETDADVYIMNWQSLRLHSRLAHIPGIALKKCSEHKGDATVKPAQCETHLKELNEIPFRSVIADEAHFMANVKAKQTRAAIYVMQAETVRYKFALTGTPISNSCVDLWPVMFGLRPEEYPIKSTFVNRYGEQKYNYWKKGMEIKGLNPHTKNEFLSFFDPVFRRMPKSLVLKDLPPIVSYTLEAEMSTKQARAYKEIEEEMFTRTDEGDLILTTNNLEKQIRLLQSASATCWVDDSGSVQLKDPSPKIDVLMDILAGTDKPVAVTAESRKLIELASTRLTKADIPHGMIIGNMTEDQRAAVLRDLKEGRIRVILFTMRAGGTGVNMAECDTIVFLERSWSMLQNIQAFGRVHRIGSEQHTSVNRFDVIAPGTVEVRQLEAIKEKYSRLQEIVRDRETLDIVNDRERLAELEQEEQVIMGSEIEVVIDEA